MMEKQERLDRYFPPLKVLAGVRQQLLADGCPPEVIPERWLPTILAAAFKWMQTTEDGLEFGGRLFHFEIERGLDERQYEVTTHEKCSGWDLCLNMEHCAPGGQSIPVRCLRELQENVKPVKSRDIYFYQGCIAERRPVPISSVHYHEKPKGICEGCSITSHCLTETKKAYSGTITNLCNHCVSYSESAQVRSEGDPSLCDECTVEKCMHHPRRGLS